MNPDTGKPGWRRRLRWWALAALIGPCLLIVGGRLALRFVELPPELFEDPPQSIELNDRHGRALREVSATELVTRKVVLADIPAALIDATLAAEDSRFWNHHGVDGRAVARAAWQWVRHRRVISGASTITQQLIKLARPRPRTLWTKLGEAAQAMRLEQIWSKQQILEAYLNRLDYGNLRRGCASASASYFGHGVRDLGLAEAALLAGIPQAPSRLNPHRHLAAAKKRQEWILDRMVALGSIGRDEAERARNTPIRLRPRGRDFKAPHFVELLLDQRPDWIRSRAGGPVATTLDLELQLRLEGSLRQHLARLAAQHVRHAAVVVIDVPSGDVLALVGSGDFFAADAGQVNGAWARRSPGSALKPFTYALALEAGATAATPLADVPTEFPTPTGVFAPVNYDRRCRGPVRLREALANSLNVPAVRLLDDLGGATVLQRRLQSCGLSTLDQPAEHYGLGLTLGNAEVRLLELANAYACLARLGEFRPCSLLIEAHEARRAVPGSPDTAGRGVPALPGCGPCPGGPTRLFDANAAWLVADILSDPDARAAAFGIDSPLRFDFPVACKTGTSTDFRDNWAFGYSPEFVVGVWMGNFDGTPMRGVSGISGAAPFMHEVMTHLHERFGTTWFPAPATLVEAHVHRLTGRLVAPGQPDALREKFPDGILPPREAPEDYDRKGAVRLPLEYAAWIESPENTLGPRIAREWPAPASAPGVDPSRSAIRLEQPLPASVFLLDPDLPEAGSWLPLRAQGTGAIDWQSTTLTVEWRRGRPYARLCEGRHELTARDLATGSKAETWIEVRRL